MNRRTLLRGGEMSEKKPCRGCRQEPSPVALWQMYLDAQLEKTAMRYPGLMPRSTSNHRIMICTDDVWGGSWSPVHDTGDELAWHMNPYLGDEA